MLCVTRYAIAAVSITLALARCKDPAAPPGTRPTMSIGSVSASENGKYIVVFTGDNAPADFAARVSARGGTVETVLDGVGVAVVSGLTDTAAGDLASTQDINAVEPEVISTAFDLIIQKLRSETVTAADDVGWFHHTALEVLAGEKFVISLLRCRWSFLERDVSALGANDYLLPFDRTHRDRIPDCFPDRAL